MSFIPPLEVLVSTANSTTAPLSAGGVFTGTAEDVSAFSVVTLIIRSDVPSVVNGLEFQFSSDGINWDVSKVHSVLVDTGHEMALVITAKFFRLVYTNGASNQTFFRAQTIFHPSKDKEVSYPITGHIDANAFAPLSRSIQTGRTTGGIYQNVGVSSDGHLKVGIHAPTSAFGEVLTVEPTPVVQVDFVYNINTDLVNTTVTGTGSVTQANSLASISTGASASSTAILNTRRYLKYRPGQGGDIKLTALFTSGVVGSEQIVGGGTSTNGYFFGFNGASFGVMRASNSVETWTAQTAWNVDKMDGTANDNNPSGMLLDPTMGNVYHISFQWLGFGAIDYSIEDPVTGIFSLVHREQYANNNTTPSVAIPSFPVHWHAANTTNTTNITIKSSSCAATIQGKVVLLGPRHSLGNTKTGVGTTLTNILTIRNKVTYQTLANQIPVILSALSGAVDGTKPATIEVYLNATLGGTPAYTDFSTTTSVIDYDTAGTTVTGGATKAIFTLAKAGGFLESVKDLDITLFPGDTLTFAGKATSGSTDVTIAPTWIEDM